MEIRFVRHAESTSNVAGRWQGHGDAPLSERGRAQARALGQRLGGQHIDLVVSSDLSRALDTARALGRPLQVDRAWRELDVGAWEGLTRRQVAERFPEQLEAVRRGDPVQVGGGESWLDLWRRIDAALSELRARLGPGGRAVVVTHGGVIHGVIAGLLGLRRRHRRPVGRVANTAMTAVTFTDDGDELVVFNDATHLSPLGPWAHERLEDGDAVVTLITHHSDRDAAAPTPPLAGWYAGLDHLYAPVGLRDAARSVAEAMGLHLPDPPWEAVEMGAVLRAAAATHPGCRVGLLVPGEAVTRLATGLACDPTATRARFGAPRHTGVCHVVVAGEKTTFADYNVGPP